MRAKHILCLSTAESWAKIWPVEYNLLLFKDPVGLGCSPFNSGDYFDIGSLLVAVPMV